MEQLQTTDSLIVSQKKEWGEIFSGFETKNKYVVMDSSGRELYFAAEEGGSLLLRLFLKGLRPFTIKILNNHGQKTVFTLTRPFRFFFHELSVFDSEGNHLGTIRKEFSILRRIYTVVDHAGTEICRLFGPIFHPWTFFIKKDGAECGKISKKWSGLLKEGFTDADNFGVSLPREWDIRAKSLLLGAVFLIDFVHFENTQ